MSAHDQIDGSSDLELEFVDVVPTKRSNSSKQDQNNEVNQDDGDALTCKDACLWIIKFAVASQTIYRWRNINFNAHGFLVLMVILDVVFFSISNVGSTGSIFQAIPYALLRNTLLIAIIIGCSILRVTLFAANKAMEISQISPAGQGVDSNSNESNQEISVDLESGIGSNGSTKAKMDIIEDTPLEMETDSIVVKSIVITYLGGLVTLRQMKSDTASQVVWFSFPTVLYLLLVLVFLVCGLQAQGDRLGAANYTYGWRYWWFWLRDAMGWSVLLSILPVPGFDGAGLLTLLLRRRGHGQTAITLWIVLLSAIVVLVAGIYGFIPPFNAFAIYLASYCAMKLMQYTCDPKNENMKVLKTMAKNTKKANDLGLLQKL